MVCFIDEQILSIQARFQHFDYSGFSHAGIQLFGRRWMVLGTPTLTA